jgi:pimeloyl-ACP methyl ester carboxylesterase
MSGMKPFGRCFVLIAISFAVVPGFAFGKSQYDACDRSDIGHLSRPLYPGHSDSREFIYSYRLRKGKDPSAPTIIYLPGGPGAYSIPLSDYASVLYGIPDAYDVIFTDPRGRGCNEDLSEDVSPNAFSTENLASDVWAAIQQLKLKKYVLFGHSYGTILATVIAARAESSKAIPAPMAIVLQGVAGHALDSPYEGFVNEWTKVKDKLPAEITAMLSRPQLPFGLSEDAWGKFIVSGLISGTSPSAENLSSQLAKLVSNDESKKEELKNAVLEAGNKQEGPSLLRIYVPIWCRELAQTDNTDMALVAGDLVGERTPGFCKSIPLTQRYDSKNWQSSAPIFYFEGENDPATAPENARYHYATHSRAPRYFVTVSQAGHVPIASLADCQDRLWPAILRGGLGFQETLSTCRWPTRLETDRPSELEEIHQHDVGGVLF